MSDLSAPLAAQSGAANAGYLPEVRAAAAANSDGNSFAAVLKEQSGKVGKNEGAPAESAGKPRDAKESSVASDKAAEATDNTKSVADAAGKERANGSEKQDKASDASSDSADAGSEETTTAQDGTITPIAAVMVQMTPAALVAAAVDAAEQAGASAGIGAIVREIARQHGQEARSAEGNKGLALARGQQDDAEAGTNELGATGQDANEAVVVATGEQSELLPGATTTSEQAQAVGTGTSGTTSGDKLALTSVGSEEAEAQASAGTGTTKASDFGQLLAQARETQSGNVVGAQRSQGSSEAAMNMRAPVGHPNWSNELGDKLTWMVGQQRQQAELVLNPPQLGRIEVSLSVNGDQASAVFASPNAAVREMLENSLPRLREILAGSGLNLGQADVGAQAFAQQQNGQEAARAGLRSDAGDNRADAGAISSGSINLGRAGERRGMVDIFA